MVKVRQVPDEEQLEALLRELCEKHGYGLEVEGWTRKTYDVYWEPGRLEKAQHMARVESLVLMNGEIRFFHDRAQTFAEELGTRLENDLGVAEAELVREKPPKGY